MTLQEAYDHLTSIIVNDLRPPKYDESVMIAKEAQTYLARTAERQRHKLKEIRTQESKEQEDQRVRLSNAITSVALGPVYAYLDEVWRTDGVKKLVKTDNAQSEAVRQNVETHFSKYYHEDTLHRYCFEAAKHYTKYDPNAWTVFEAIIAPGQQGETTIRDLYPVEVLSDEVRSYAFDQTGQLQYLAFEFGRTVHLPDKPKNTKTLSDFYLYGIGYALHFAEYDDYYTDGVDYSAAGYALQEVGTRTFWTRTFANGTTEVPAIRWSAYLSDQHRRMVGETMVASAIPKIEELLKDNSLFQLQKYLHIYAEKQQYVRRCNHRDEQGRECQGGTYGGTYRTEDTCQACRGSGKVMAASEQDVVTLAWPDRAEDLVDLSKLTNYVERPIDIVQFYDAQIRYHFAIIFLAIFNQQNVNVEDVMQPMTATQSRLDYDKIYNKLSPFAELVSRAWEKAQRTAFQYYGASAQVDMTYPHDFKLKSITELIAEYNAAKDAGAPYEVLQSIAFDMLAKQYRNMPAEALDVAAFERWRPWKAKNPEEITVTLQSRDTTDPDRVLWENWDQTVEQVRLSMPDGRHFHEIQPDQQRATLYEAAAALNQGIVYKSMPDPFALPVMDQDDEDDEQE